MHARFSAPRSPRGLLSAVKVLCAALVLTATTLSGVSMDPIQSAHADARVTISRPFAGKRPIELSIRGSAYYGYGWYDGLKGFGRYYSPYSFGPGIQLLFPVLHNGFISSINNAFYLGFFSDLTLIPDNFGSFGNTIFGITFGPVAQWRFGILDLFTDGSLSAFVNLGFGLWPWFTRGRYAGVDNVVFYGFPLLELGANLYFTRNIGLMLSFGYPTARLAVNIAF